MGGARALMRKLTSQKVKAEKVQKLKQEHGRRQLNPPTTLEDIPERHKIKSIMEQAETAHVFDPDRIVKANRAHRPGDIGKHRFYRTIHLMSVLLPHYAELLKIKDQYDDPDLWEAQRKEIWNSILEVWRDSTYHRAITSYFKHGHIVGPKAYEEWKFAEKEAIKAEAYASAKRKPARRKGK